MGRLKLVLQGGAFLVAGSTLFVHLREKATYLETKGEYVRPYEIGYFSNSRVRLHIQSLHRRWLFGVRAADFGTVEVSLFDEDAPRACKNFLLLCEGRIPGPDGKNLSYAGSQIVHEKGAKALCSGTLGSNMDLCHSALGARRFKRDAPLVKNRSLRYRGLLSMLTNDTDGGVDSRFRINLMPMIPRCDRDVVIGQVTRGYHVLEQVEESLKSPDQKSSLVGFRIKRCEIFRRGSGRLMLDSGVWTLFRHLAHKVVSGDDGFTVTLLPDDPKTAPPR